MEKVFFSYSDPAVVQIYAQKKHTGLWHAEEILVKRYVPPKQITLDLGAGTGRTTIPLRAMGFPTIALDISYAMLQQNSPPYLQATATHLPFKEKTFTHVLFSYNGLCHVDKHMRHLCVREIGRVLKDHGIFLFTIEPREWYHLRSVLPTVVHAGSEKEFLCPFYRIRKQEMRQMLSDSGFIVLYEGYKEDFTQKDDYPNCYFFVAEKH